VSFVRVSKLKAFSEEFSGGENLGRNFIGGEFEKFVFSGEDLKVMSFRNFI